MIVNEKGQAMTKQEVLAAYIAAEKPYEVCIHTNMGGYMEFCRLECGIMFEDNAKMVCDKYAETMRKGKKSENFKAVCVRKSCTIIYEVNL